MKKHTMNLAFTVLALLLVFSLSACLDPVNMIPDLNFNLSGDINFTDVTAGAFVLNNLSQTISVTRIDVRHVTYTPTMQNAIINGGGAVVRRFDGEPGPGEQKAIFANASEDNYTFEIFWEVEGQTGQIDARFAMPASRMVREFYLFKTEATDTPDPCDGEGCDFHDADGKCWLIIVTDWVPGLLVSDPGDTLVNIENLYIDGLTLDLKDMIRNVVNVEPVIQNIFDKSLFEDLIFEFNLPFTVDQFFEAISKAQINVQVEPEINLNAVLTMDPEFRAYLEETQLILNRVANGIDLIAEGVGIIARGFVNGSLILYNNTNQDILLSSISIVPMQDTVNSLTRPRYTLETDALFARLASWRNVTVPIPRINGSNISSTTRELPAGEYMITYGGRTSQISVLAGIHTDFTDEIGSTNVFILEGEGTTSPDCPCDGGDKCDCGNDCKCPGCDCPDCDDKTDPLVSSIRFSVLMSGFHKEATAAQAAAVPNRIVQYDLGATSVALPTVIYDTSENISVAQRQAIVDHSNELWKAAETGSSGPVPPIPGTSYGINHSTGQPNYNLLIGSGINASGSFWGFRPYYVRQNTTNAFIIYRIHPDANNGHEIWLQINFR